MMVLLAELLETQPEIGAKKAFAAVRRSSPPWADRLTAKAVRTALAEAKAAAISSSTIQKAVELPPVICPRLGRPLPRVEKGWLERKWLHIEDPFETSHNVADVLMKLNERRVYNEIKRAADMLGSGAKLRAIM